MKREGETKRKLLDVAFRLIWEQSYGSVGVDDICRQAGVTKGSFYFAFPSKSDLAVAAFEEQWQRKQPLLDATFSAQVPAAERFTRYCEGIIADQKAKYIELGKMCGCPYCSVGSELSTQDEKVRLKAEQMMERMIRYLTGAVAALQAEDQIPAEDPKAVARQIYDFIIGLLLQAKIENSPAALDRLTSGVFRILGLKVGAAAAA